jgi:hypothetical protein
MITKKFNEMHPSDIVEHHEVSSVMIRRLELDVLRLYQEATGLTNLHTVTIDLNIRVALLVDLVSLSGPNKPAEAT